ncbi:hypothetical protein CJ030_MR4G029078 [Morella rubra]|uniref:Uncharacterized protein n=1 Tax=Morella rubra TaxID=262757 RepID=A0A6A1VTF0_9ROSI|nr:hypothetical protein CJ030_MR4G029078 [Morella rubra]
MDSCCDLFASEEFQRRSAINKENRAKLKIVHTSGARSFQRESVVSKLEEARLEIEEMRARQMEYEALLVKRSDMEQTMREHLQMMEEQQRKKDEELMQMMAGAATEKRQRASEDDAGTTKEPSGTTRTEDATNGGADA